jgi:hypothetical protein
MKFMHPLISGVRHKKAKGYLGLEISPQTWLALVCVLRSNERLL